MKRDNLLRDAILEARQVKAAAIANAKAALEESFKPHFASVLTAKLRNEIEDHTSGDGYGSEDGGETDVKAVMEQKPLKSSEIGGSDNKEPAKAAKSSSDIKNPEQEVKKMEEMKDGVVAPGDGHEKVLDQLKEFDEEGSGEDVVDLDDEGGDDAFGGEDSFGGDDEFGADDAEGSFGGGQDIDLEALIRELEADIMGDQGASAPSFGQKITREDKSAAASKDSVKQTVDLEPHLAPEGEKENLKLSENDEEVDEDINIEEMIREMDVQDQGRNPQHYAKVEELQAENVELKRNLKEHRDVVRFLKDRINEINMLNAKLLFTNKLFKSFNLNSGQKMHIVETFDRASTIREVKLVFTTLMETLGNKGKNASTKTITEGFASKAVGSTKPKSEQKVLTEDSDVVRARFQKLAGIIS